MAVVAIATDSERNETEFNTKPFHDRYIDSYIPARIFCLQLIKANFEKKKRLIVCCRYFWWEGKCRQKPYHYPFFTELIDQSIYFILICISCCAHCDILSASCGAIACRIVRAYRISHLHPLKNFKAKICIWNWWRCRCAVVAIARLRQKSVKAGIRIAADGKRFLWKLPANKLAVSDWDVSECGKCDGPHGAPLRIAARG